MNVGVWGVVWGRGGRSSVRGLGVAASGLVGASVGAVTRRAPSMETDLSYQNQLSEMWLRRDRHVNPVEVLRISGDKE